MTSEEMIFECLFFFSLKFSISVAMTTNQIQRFGQKLYVGRELLKEHFCKIFVIISAVTYIARPFLHFPHYKSVATFKLP